MEEVKHIPIIHVIQPITCGLEAQEVLEGLVLPSMEEMELQEMEQVRSISVEQVVVEPERLEMVEMQILRRFLILAEQVLLLVEEMEPMEKILHLVHRMV
jgi:hypothetical protein